jgi:hypothetical protein
MMREMVVVSLVDTVSYNVELENLILNRYYTQFCIEIYSKYIKNIGIKLVSLKSMLQYIFNNTNFI